jgi:predicted transcriptional regulator
MIDVLNSLQHLGLTEKEARVYVALLKFTEAPAGEIADEAGIKRPTTYVVLEDLRKKGLVIKLPHAKRTLFQAKTPDEFYNQSISNINQFEKVLPRLRSMNPSKKNIKTLYFEGLDGVKEALYYKFEKQKGGTTDGFWAKDDGAIPKPLMEMFHKWNMDMKKNGMRITGVTPNHPSVVEFSKRYQDNSDVILAPQDDYNSDVSIEITQNFVRIVDGHDLKAIIIENDRLSDALRQIFVLAKRNYTN